MNTLVGNTPQDMGLKFNKVRRLFLCFLLSVSSFVTLAEGMSSYSDPSIAYTDLSSGTPSNINYVSHYYEQPASSSESYSHYVADQLASKLAGSEANYHIEVRTGYGCAYQACAKVTLDHGDFSHVFYITVGDRLQLGSPGTPGVGYAYFGEESSAHSGGSPQDDKNRGPSPGAMAGLQHAKDKLNDAVRELDRANESLRAGNQRLSTVNRELDSARSDLQRIESTYATVLAARNKLAVDAKNVAHAAQLAKQKMEDSKTEVGRLENERDKQNRIKIEKAGHLASLREEVSRTLGTLNANLNNHVNQEIVAVTKWKAGLRDQIQNGIDEHNNAVSPLNELAHLGDPTREPQGIGSETYRSPLFDTRSVRNIFKGSRTYEAPVRNAELQEAKGRFKTQLARRNEVREQIQNMDRYEVRSELVERATASLQVSMEHYLKDEFDEGGIAAQMTDVLLDLATSLTPGISWARDLYEAVVGRNLHNGEELNAFDRSMAVLGVVTVGFGSKIGKAFKVLSNLMKGEKGSEAYKAGKTIFHAAEKHSIDLRKADLNRLKTNPLNGTRNSRKVQEQVLLGDYHAFPKEVDNFAGLGTKTRIVGGDKVSRRKIELSGSYDGKQGRFEWIIEPGEEISHRLFVVKRQ